jgi:HK97 family phage major capsid protein/HK97 family phage prohead protease
MMEIIERRLEQTTGNDWILSDGEPDRMGDIIEPDAWQLDRFEPVALFNHSRHDVIGRWERVRVEQKALRGSLRLADQGTSPVVDMVRALHEQGLLDTVSVGFRALEREPLDPKDPYGGQRFKRVELLEASLVSVPANPRARRIAKHFLPEETYRRLLTVPGAGSGDDPGRTGVSARSKSTLSQKAPPMEATQVLPIGKRIEQQEKKITGLKDRLAELDRTIAGSDGPNDEQRLEIESAGVEIDQATKNLELYKATEKRLLSQVAKQDEIKAPAIVMSIAPRKVKPRDIMFRGLTCALAMSRMKERGKFYSAEEAVRDLYGGDQATEIYLKAAMTPGTMTVAGWAAELVNQVMGEFLDLLPVNSIYPTLSSMGQRYTFGQSGIIKIPTRAATPAINGAFVGEGAPIPVKRMGLSSISLTPKKLAVISEFTKELDAHSTPNIEGLIRSAINRDTAIAIDKALIDQGASDTVRPASIISGATTAPTGKLAASAATATIDKVIADIKALEAFIVGNGGGSNLLLILAPSQALTLNMLVTANGEFPFSTVSQQGGTLFGIRVVVSQTMADAGVLAGITGAPANFVIMVDADAFASVTADVPEFMVTDIATIHEEDTTPKPIVASPATPPNPVLTEIAAPVRSLFQTYSMAVRMVLPMNWAMLRPTGTTGMVAWIGGVGW